MSSFPYKLPSSQNQLGSPYTVPNNFKNGTHFSIYGVGGYMEVQYLSELSYSSQTIPINITFNANNDVTLILNNDNVSSGRRRLGMLAYVYETDTIYQFYIPNYDIAFNTATGSSAYQKRYTTFGTYETYVYPNSATTLLFSGWTGDTIEGVSGVTSATASWRKLSFSGGTPSGGTVSGSGTLNFIPKWTNSTTLGNSQIYNDGTSVYISVPLSGVSFSSTTIYLGIDSSGNTRTITADSIILDSDILDGGSY